jgi:predicted dehydrogenase
MSESKIRIGILGGGSMGSVHAERLRQFTDVEGAGVFSRDRDHAAAAARICGAKATTDPMELIAEPSVDAVDVCVPSASHRQFVIAALEKGKHVFCENPFALSIEDGRAMIDAAHESKTHSDGRPSGEVDSALRVRSSSGCIGRTWKTGEHNGLSAGILLASKCT